MLYETAGVLSVYIVELVDNVRLLGRIRDWLVRGCISKDGMRNMEESISFSKPLHMLHLERPQSPRAPLIINRRMIASRSYHKTRRDDSAIE